MKPYRPFPSHWPLGINNHHPGLSIHALPTQILLRHQTDKTHVPRLISGPKVDRERRFNPRQALSIGVGFRQEEEGPSLTALSGEESIGMDGAEEHHLNIRLTMVFPMN